jgi:hypothetical protein
MQRFALSVPSEYDGITRERCQTLVTQWAAYGDM